MILTLTLKDGAGLTDRKIKIPIDSISYWGKICHCGKYFDGSIVYLTSGEMIEVFEPMETIEDEYMYAKTGSRRYEVPIEPLRK